MTDFDQLLQLPQGKLTHPLIAEWALTRLQDHENSPRLNVMADSWFHDLVLAHWLAGEGKDDEMTSLLLLYLPTHRFAGFLPALERLWNGVQYPHLAARHLVKLAPGRTAELFLEAVQTPTDQGKTLAILEHLPALDDESRRRCFDGLLQQFDASGEKGFPHFATHYFVAAHAVSPELSLPLAARFVDLLPEDDANNIENLFSVFARTAFGHVGWFELGARKLEDNTQYRFADLGDFFQPGAPLDAMDQVISGDDLFEKALSLFQLAPRDHPAIRFAQYLLDHCRYAGDKAREVMLREYFAAFLLAAVAHTFERPQPATLDMETAIRLLGADIEPMLWHGKLLETLLHAPREDVIPALIGRLKETRDTWGEIQVAQTMGELAYPEFSTALIEAVSEQAGDLVCEQAKKALERIGEPALPSLVSQWDGFDSAQRIYLLSAITDIGGAMVADFACARFNELMNDDLEYALECVLCAPDRRFLPLLAPQLNRRQWLIDKTYVVLCRLLDEHPEGFDGVEARALEDYRSDQEKHKRFDSGDLYQDSLRVELRCTACGGVNTYNIQQIHIGKEEASALLPGEEFPCASCGIPAEFEFTSLGKMAVLGGLTMLVSQRKDEQTILPHSMFQSFELPFEGRSRAVSEIVMLCRQRLEQNQDDVRSLLILGICYAQIQHPVKARERLLRAHRLAPLAAEVSLNLAQVLVDSGQKNEVGKLLENFPQQAAKLQFILSEYIPPKQTATELARLYNAVRPHGAPAFHPGAIAAPAKAGRNDPCPCGSGKKYKKCCGGA